VTALILAAAGGHGAGLVNGSAAPVAATGSASQAAQSWPEPLRLRRILEAAGPGSLMPENSIVAGIHLGTNTVCHVQNLGHEGSTLYVGQLDEAATVRWHVARDVHGAVIACDGGNVLVAWGWAKPKDNGLAYACSTDNGGTKWSCWNECSRPKTITA
jgi:hypothetical protein